MSSHAHNHKTNYNAFEEQANRKQTHTSFLKNIADASTPTTAATKWRKMPPRSALIAHAQARGGHKLSPSNTKIAQTFQSKTLN
jgi:hypothetical protein